MSTSSEDDQPANGVRKFHLGALDSSSDSDSDRRARKVKNTEDSRSAAKTKLTRRPGANLDSSLELSTSSSSNSSASSGVPALPAAFRRAAAATAAAALHQHQQDKSSSDDDGVQAKHTAASRLQPSSEQPDSALQATANQGDVGAAPASATAPVKGPGSPSTFSPVAPSQAVSRVGAFSGHTAPATLPGVRAVEADSTAGSPASASSPTLRSGSDFFFKKPTAVVSPAPTSAASTTHESSVPAAISKFAVHGAGSDDDETSSISSSSAKKFTKVPAALTSQKPPSESSNRAAALTASTKTIADGAASASAAPAANPPTVQLRESFVPTTVVAVDDISAANPPVPAAAGLSLKSFSIAAKQFGAAGRAAEASSSSSSSASSTPRLAASAAGRAAHADSPLSSSISSSDAGKRATKSGLARLHVTTAPSALATSAVGAAAAVEATAAPPAFQIKKLALQLDSDEETPVRHAGPASPSSSTPAGGSAETETKQLIQSASASVGLSFKSAAPSSNAMKRQVSATLPPTQAHAYQDPRPVSQSVAADPASAGGSAGGLGAAGPSPASPAEDNSSNLVYNRVSVRGIGSVPASVIEAPTRPRRRALPTEHTVTESTASEVGRASSQQSKLTLPPGGTDAAGKGKCEVTEKTSSETVQGTSAPYRPQRQAPRTPTPARISLPPPPPSLLEESDKEEEKKADTAERSHKGSVARTAADLTTMEKQPCTGAVKRAFLEQSPPSKHSAIAGKTSEAATHGVEARATSQASQAVPPPPTPYVSRAAATAAAQRQREAALIIYDDRVPPALRSGGHAQPFTTGAIPQLSRDPVAASMVLKAPVGYRNTAAWTHVPWEQKEKERFECRPVLHVGGQRQMAAALRRKQDEECLELQKTSEDLMGSYSGYAERVERPPHLPHPQYFSPSSDNAKEADVLRSRGRRAACSPRGASRSPTRSAKSHVSDAVVQQLLQQFGPPGLQGLEKKTNGTPASGVDGALHVLSTGRGKHVLPRDEKKGRKGRESGGGGDGGGTHLSSPLQRRRPNEMGEVDPLNYRSSRAN